MFFEYTWQIVGHSLGQQLRSFTQINVFFLVHVHNLFPEGHALGAILTEEVLRLLFSVLQDVDNLHAVPVVNVCAVQ